MNETELRQIEERLRVALPDYYRKTMLDYPFPKGSYADECLLPNDPHGVIDLNSFDVDRGSGLFRFYVGSDCGSEMYFVDPKETRPTVQVLRASKGTTAEKANNWTEYLAWVSSESDSGRHDSTGGPEPAASAAPVFAGTTSRRITFPALVFQLFGDASAMFGWLMIALALSQVWIWTLFSDPLASFHPTSSTSTATPPFVLLVLLVFLISGALMALNRVVKGLSDIWLLTHGYETVAEVDGVQETIWRLRGGRVYTVTFRFQTDDGSSRKIVKRTSEIRGLKNHAPRILLYDQRNPARAAVPDLLPGRPVITPTGEVRIPRVFASEVARVVFWPLLAILIWPFLNVLAMLWQVWLAS